MAKTKIIWTTAFPQFVGIKIDDALATFVAAGKTDGTPTITEDGDLRIVERTWVDTESAQAWLDFFTAAGGKPESAIVIE